VNPGLVKGFVRVDIANPGEEMLIQQEGFDHPPRGLNPADKFPARDF
jgi:hypothetical protein